MDLQLMRLKKLAGYKSRDVFADKIGVNRRTTTKISGRRHGRMALEQAYNCAVINCHRRIAGLVHAPASEDPRAALERYYDAMDDEGHAVLAESARLMSRNRDARP